MFDYASLKEWPKFQVDFTLYPNKNQQVKTIRFDVIINNF
jgi:hypothetical protein